MLALVGAMYGFLHDLVAVRVRAQDWVARQRAANTVLDELESRLACAIVGDATAGVGLQGDSSSLTLLSRGVVARLATPTENDAPLLSDLQRLELQLEDERLEATLDKDRYDLGPIAELALRYYDGREWVTEFDSGAAGALPVAIEVGLWLERPPDPDAQDATPDRLRLILIPDAREIRP